MTRHRPLRENAAAPAKTKNKKSACSSNGMQSISPALRCSVNEYRGNRRNPTPLLIRDVKEILEGAFVSFWCTDIHPDNTFTGASQLSAQHVMISANFTRDNCERVPRCSCNTFAQISSTFDS
ncbi:hypothetical protein TraAM80_05981 [Trypanosoma rangeli]|uniref:Uncharacterized protein n=1 Tax=Trypanosoma rangeli TaxID=5698 RepID=A0A422NCC0_TRYRA|nr:uncharacterized protein TraAM80_05981 [Trypanosoma rangeli]RNF03113.1 hypothetical protein TraAM80_05981 [Trypanosoma rangeli]|eukprot:RNF03113.1 hypothetical protein TraAM80_05981 [Trypanosoma rangeli]